MDNNLKVGNVDSYSFLNDFMVCNLFDISLTKMKGILFVFVALINSIKQMFFLQLIKTTNSKMPTNLAKST